MKDNFQGSFSTTLYERSLGLHIWKQESIQRSVSSIDWDFLFQGKSINKDGWHTKWVFEELHNKVVQCDYRQPPLMTDSIRNTLKERVKWTKKYF